MKKLFCIGLALSGLYLTPMSQAADMAGTDDYVPTLITKTPFEGRQLAIMLSRKSIGAIQSNPDVKKRLRGVYSQDAAMLMQAAQIVAIEYQTIAAANNYWRK